MSEIAAGEQADEAQPSSGSERGLDWLNFFLADVQTAFGPFIAVYLASNHWSQGQIGVLLTVGGLAGIAVQIPGGWLVDWAAAKRLLVGLALAAIAASALLFALSPNPATVFGAEILHGITAGVAKPALAAIGLGLVGHHAFSRRLGRNDRYNAFGTAATAVLMGIVGETVGQQAPFLLAAALCLPAAWSLRWIRAEEIDYARARSARDRGKPRECSRIRDLVKDRRLLVFMGSLMLFQLSDASVMPLASGQLGQQHAQNSEFVTSALVAVQQVVNGLLAFQVARHADGWGRKPLLLAGFAILPLRALLFAVAPSPWYLVAGQIPGGLTAAVLGIMTPLVVADIARGSGRYNLAQGAAGLTTALGAAVSTAISGYVAQLLGYAVGFVVVGIFGLLGFAAIFFLFPETAAHRQR